MTDQNPSRRSFLAASAAAASALSLSSRELALGKEFKSTIRKAMIVGKVTEDNLNPYKDAGFAGVEVQHICDEKEAESARAFAEKIGMRIHSVMRGWASFNSEDQAKADESLEVTRKAMRAAKAYGADDILLVPCRIGGMPMPQPWDFKIEFDEKTGHVSRVVDGDNSPYEAYIKAQNRATDTSRIAVEKLIPLAEELKIIVGIENVWNNLWVKPELYKNFVSSFNHPLVRPYFDIGNHVKYQPPEDWIRLLGKSIVRLHFKDFRVDHSKPNGGDWRHLREGSINWKAVREALEEVDFDGWGSIEESGLPLKEFSRRFDLILAGE
jgi:hexulose-6-phosphate isomerase